MKYCNTIFWNVDTQFDFMDPTGKLYVPQAENIKPLLASITKFAQNHSIKVINTADHHHPNSGELSNKPDFITTFPPHCMANSKGAEYIMETMPPKPRGEVLWDTLYTLEQLEEIAQNSNIIIRKDAFDVFLGNPNTDPLLQILKPRKIVVYGVTTNVCVHHAVMGLAQRGIQVLVIEDAIKELPKLPLPYKEWERAGVKLILSKNIKEHIF